jgi:hypothetical protein
MTLVLTRWLAVVLVAVAFGLAGLQLSVCIAGEQGRAPAARPRLFTDAPEPELPSAAEFDQSEVSASPRLTW